MSAITVTTTPQQLPAAWSDIQNLSGSDVYFDSVSSVSSTTGIKLPAGTTYSRPDAGGWWKVWVVTATGTADLRVMASAV